MRAAIGRNALAGMLLLFVLTLLPLGVAMGADPASAKEASSSVEYARRYAQLAQLNLQSALLINQRNPNTLPKAQIAVLQEQVVLADEWLLEAQDTAAGKAHNSAVAVSEILFKAAEADYANTLQVNQIAPLSQNGLQRAQLKFELAKLRLEMARKVDPKSPLALLQFQLDRLRESVSEMAAQRLRAVDLD